MPPLQLASKPWVATRVADSDLKDTRLSPLAVDERWLPLGQGWLGSGTSGRINSGWARIQWSTTALHFDVVFLAAAPKNRAARLNERTWELGDVCEIFVHASHVNQYAEVHVTPENQRLQLLWPVGELERVRRQERSLESFMIDNPHWVRSSSYLGPGFWSVHVVIPFACLGLDFRTSTPTLRAAVCRYDYGERTEPVLSSTAPLTEPDYHRWTEWQLVDLAANPSD